MKRFLFCLMAVLAFVGCTDEGPDDGGSTGGGSTQPQTTITLTTTALNFTTEGGSQNVTFTSSGDWTAQVLNDRANDWCKLTPASGAAGNGQITVTAAANATTDERSASIVLKSGTVQKTIKVTQKQKDALTITASKFEVAAEGGTVAIEVKANIDFERSCFVPWIKLYNVTVTRSMKTTTLTFKVDKNEDPYKREGHIIIKSGEFEETITIYQEGSEPSIVISKNEYIVSPDNETIVIEVKSNVFVDVTSPDVNWITENTTRGVSTNTYYFDIAKNTSNDQRTAAIAFYDVVYKQAEQVSITQVQKNAIVLAKNEYIFGYEGGEINLDPLTSLDVIASISNDAKGWILPVLSEDPESKKLVFNIATNTENVYREGTITLSDGETEQIVAIKQNYDTGSNTDVSQVPDNEIWYRTIDGQKHDIYYGLRSWYEVQPLDATITSHTYENGIGKIVCNKTITRINNWAFVHSDLHPTHITELYLPETIEYIEGGGIRDNEYLTTLRIPKNLKEIEPGGLENNNLESFTGDNKYVTADGRCLIIDGELLAVAPKGITEYIIPDNVKVISDYIFRESAIEKVIFPEGLEKIGSDAFSDCKNLKSVTFPSSLQDIDIYAFTNCPSLEGFYGNEKFHTSDNRCLIDILDFPSSRQLASFAGYGLSEYTIPNNEFDMIQNYAFYSETLTEITLPSSITSVAGWAFAACPNLETVYGPYVSADNRAFVYNNVFGPLIARKNMPTKYHIPDDVTMINHDAFICPEVEEITMGDQITHIGSYAFGCPNLRSLTLSAGLKEIVGYNPFPGGSDKLESIYCRALIPPIFDMGYDPLVDVNNKNLRFYVPEETLATYQNDPNWIMYHKYFVGYKYTDLPNNDVLDHYISTDFSADGEVIVLQEATKGNGIDLVLIGDAYSDRLIADGTYDKTMNIAMENFFAVEPYKSFREYFNVYYVTAVSMFEEYLDNGQTALRGEFGDGTHVGGNANQVVRYALKAISEERMDEAMIAVIMNSSAYAGTCYYYQPTSTKDYSVGMTISYIPVGVDETTFKQILQHETGGHGFAKLADEYAYEYMGTVHSEKVIVEQSRQTKWGWKKNIDFTSDVTAVRWAKFISDSRYANEKLGAYEGAMTYWSGVWRPTDNSIMRYNTGGFNAPSREAIYYRIHKLAYGDEWTYDYETFVKYDEINRTTTTTTQSVPMIYKPTAPPVVMQKTWRDELR